MENISQQIENIDIIGLICLLVILGIILFFIVNGYRKGFIKIFAGLASAILTFYLVSLFTPAIVSYLEHNTTIYERMTARINEAFLEQNKVRDNTIKENHEETIESYGLPGVIKEILLSNDTQEVYEGLSAKLFEEYVSKFLAKKLLNILVFFICFIIIMILLQITFLSMSLIANLPVIKGFNKNIGAIFGLFQGLFVVWMIFSISTALFGSSIDQLVNRNPAVAYMYNNNLLFRLIDILLR